MTTYPARFDPDSEVSLVNNVTSRQIDTSGRPNVS